MEAPIGMRTFTKPRPLGAAISIQCGRMKESESLAPSGLRHTLRQRHMTMIAFGGVIGAGLFVGSGVVIESAGPAAVLSFVITGVLVVIVMRMLAEMAVAAPAV